jgi:NADH-quinone oxidoreductase subunit N
VNEFVAPQIDWTILTPVLFVLGAGVVGVLVEAFVPERARRTTQLVLTLGALVGSMTSVVLLWDRVAESAQYIVDGTFLLTPFTLGIQLVIGILALLGVLVVADRTRTAEDAFAPTAAAVPGTAYEDAAREAGLRQTEIFPLLLFSTGGMLLFPATDNLIVLFIALEVLSLPLYVLCATARRRRLLSQEAAFKYFLLGSFASALMLFGIALVYGATATVSLENAVYRLVQPEAAAVLPVAPGLLFTGVLLVTVGLLFKIGAAPFHTWTPDVYQGAPTPITGFMAACVKAAAIGALVRVMFTLAVGLSDDLREHLEVGLWVVAILTMVIGTAAGAVQTDVKRMLAYSSIAHAGFLVVALVGLDETSARAVLFYVLAYGLATVGAFAIVTLVRERDADGVVLGEATDLTQWAGLGRRAPWLTAAFCLFLLSMAGIPLTAGFIAKFSAFSAAVDAGAWPLAVIGVLASVVAVFFYVRLIVLMVLTPTAEAAEATAADEPVEGGATSSAPGTATTALAARVTERAAVVVVASRGPATVAITLCVVGVVLLGVLPGAALDWMTKAADFRP